MLLGYWTAAEASGPLIKRVLPLTTSPSGTLRYSDPPLSSGLADEALRPALPLAPASAAFLGGTTILGEIFGSPVRLGGSLKASRHLSFLLADELIFKVGRRDLALSLELLLFLDSAVLVYLAGGTLLSLAKSNLDL